LDDVLREKFDDLTYLYAKFVKDYLKKKVEISRELKINLLERKINEGIEEDKKWNLVYEFPKCMQELLEFEEKIDFIHVSENPAYIR